MHTSNLFPDLTLNPEGAVYLQIADYFKMQIALGKLLPGERLPAIRRLAEKLGLDPGTVARAYRELEKHGITFGRRGGGSYVSSRLDKPYLLQQNRNQLAILLERVILEALGKGFSLEEIETAFITRLAQWRERRIQAGEEEEITSHHSAAGIRFFGSHDIIIDLLSGHLQSLRPEMNFVASFTGSLAGLIALACGEADISGAHLFDQESGEFNKPFITRLMPNETVVLINLVQRVQGLMFAPGNPRNIFGIKDLKRPDIVFVNRQKGSGTRIFLDSQLLNCGITPGEVRGYELEEKTHIAVANRIAQGEADVGLGTQSAASIAGLDFIPLFKECYDLVVLQAGFEQSWMQRVMEVIRSDGFQKMVKAIPGYDLSETGRITILKPNQR